MRSHAGRKLLCDGVLCHVAGARHADHVTQAARPTARALAQALAQNPEEAALFYLAEHQTSCALPHLLSWCRPKSSRRSLPPAPALARAAQSLTRDPVLLSCFLAQDQGLPYSA